MRRSATLALAAGSGCLIALGASAWAIGQPGCAAGCFVGATLLALTGWWAASRMATRATGAPAVDTRLSEQQIADQVIAAEQDERRRLALMLHDGPLQNLSGISLMHDATLAALQQGEVEEAIPMLERSLARERQTIQTIRDLMVAMEPLVLRDHGFEAAVKALAATIERDGTIGVSLRVADGDGLPEKAQVALYQVLREALAQARKRKPAMIFLDVVARPDGGVGVSVADDGVEERRRASLEAIQDRVRTLKARVEMDTGPGGTVVRIFLPPYVASAPAPAAATA